MSLRFAVFGTGFWSTLQIPAWFEAGDVQCAALWNRTVQKALDTAGKYHINKVYESAEELLKNEQLDFADIITEVPAHEELVLLCARYKVPVICQKPMSYSFESCKRMVAACRKAGNPFYIHENWKYRAPFVQLRKVLAQNPVGRIRRVAFNGVNGGQLAYNAQPFLKTLPHMAITDLGSHLFDIARILFGEPESLYCSGVRTYDDLAGENFVSVLWNYPDKVCTLTIGENLDNFLFLDGEDGTLTMRKDYAVVVEGSKGTKVYEPPAVKEYAWAAHTKDYLPPDHVQNIIDCNKTFYDALITGKPPENTAEENLKTMRLVYGACTALETKAIFDVSACSLY